MNRYTFKIVTLNSHQKHLCVFPVSMLTQKFGGAGGAQTHVTEMFFLEAKRCNYPVSSVLHSGGDCVKTKLTSAPRILFFFN